MKSRIKKRVTAFVLCMAMVLSGSISTLAEDATADSAKSANNIEAGQNEKSQSATASDGGQTAPAAESEKTPAKTESTQQPAAEPAASEAASEAVQPEAAPETAPVQEAMELKQEIKDADGNVISTVTANIPEAAFNADTASVTMEVTEIAADTSEEIKGLMEKSLAADKVLGGYFLYNVNFKVDGQITEPGREIKLTFEQKDFKVEDTKKATAFYYNAAHSTAGNEAAEIVEIQQKSELTEALQNAGQSTDNIDDYDLCEITLKEDGTADQIQMEGRRSTVYGCFVEEPKPEEEVAAPEPNPGEETKPAEEQTTAENTELKKAVLKSANSSSFTVTWMKWNYGNSKKATITFKYVDEQGNEIPNVPGIPEDRTIQSGQDYYTSVYMPEYEKEIPGYSKCKKATIDTVNGTEIQWLDLSDDQLWYYKGGNGDWKSWRKLTKPGTTGTVYMVYAKEDTPPTAPDDPGTIEEPKPSLAKRAIKSETETDKYDLELDVSSSIGSETNPAKLDVLLIMDRSASMKNGGKMEAAKTAAKNLVTSLGGYKNLDVQYALVSFAGSTSNWDNGSLNNATIDSSWVSTPLTVNSKIEKLSPAGGTNYDAAFQQAATVMRDSKVRTDAKKVVIFLTDGEPTVYVGGGKGSGDSTEYNDVDKARISLESMPKVDYFYSIGYGDAFTNKRGVGYTVLNALTNGGDVTFERETISCPGATVSTTKALKTAAQAGDIAKVFKEIMEEITRIACKNVVVTDTLSENIENAEDTTYRLRITRKADGIIPEAVVVETKPINWGKTSTVDATSKTQSYSERIDEKEETNHVPLNFNALAGAKFTFNGKTITCTYPEAYELSPDYIYTILIDQVNVTKTAYIKYEQNNSSYTDISDANTGTHAEDNGFFSNDNDKAKMTYTVKTEEKSEKFPKPVVQLFEDEEEEQSYIKVQKTFEGLSAPKAQVPDFSIVLYSDEACTETVATLKLKGSSDNVTLVESDDGLTYTWKIKNLGTGTYYLKESGQTVADYTLKTLVNGKVMEGNTILVTTQDAVYDITDIEQINKCNNTTLPFENSNFIAAILTDQTYFVWTEDTLSAGERSAIVSAINESATGNLGNIDINKSDIAFFSTRDKIEKGIDYRGTISVKDGKLTFAGTNQWSHVCYGTYSRTGAVNAEIEITNTYTEAAVDIDLKKYGSEYTTKLLTGATFNLYKGNKPEGTGTVTWEENPMEGYSDIQVKDPEKELKLKTGYYKLVETTAPNGYQLLEKPICFKVTGQTVTLIDEKTGNELGATQDMWKLDDKNDICISIKNNVVYDLPEAGGIGIYWYLIGGVLLMLAATLILYKNKYREVRKG